MTEPVVSLSISVHSAAETQVQFLKKKLHAHTPENGHPKRNNVSRK